MPAPFPLRLRVVSIALAMAALVAGASYLALPTPLTQRAGSAFLVIPLSATAWMFIASATLTIAGHWPMVPWLVLRVAHALGGSLYAAYAVALIGYAVYNGSALTAGIHAAALAVAHFAVLVAIPTPPKGSA